MAVFLRIRAAECGSWSQGFLYDGFGNLQGSNGAAVTPADPATNRPAGPTYDANGLPTGLPPNTGFGWDVENRLTMQEGPGGAIFWTYDPYGKRVMKQAYPTAG